MVGLFIMVNDRLVAMEGVAMVWNISLTYLGLILLQNDYGDLERWEGEKLAIYG